MNVKIKPVVNVLGVEELIILPITRNREYLLSLNFYEDVLGGRMVRIVLVLDKYNEIMNDITAIKGKKAVVEASGIKEDMDKLSKIIHIDNRSVTDRIPIYFDIEILKDVDTSQRGVRGFINYVHAYGKPDLSKILNSLQLNVEEIR
ncbi:hypothetical protein SUSAZ_02505 [Sulfolobus acidocaldarius SUSAZ]|nr:hypothetical protein SUSAZ_02505 [Sulfolobus acidocaldarius SUSAZ]